MDRLLRYRTPLVLGGLVLGALGLFVFDVSTPPGVADGIGYPILLILCLWLPRRSVLVACAWGSTFLTVAAAFVVHSGGVGLEGSLVNRGLAIASIWVIYLLLLQRTTMEDDVRASEQRAVAASQAKANFLANMSHQLRTPLDAVIDSSGLIAKEAFGPVGDPRYREYAENIQLSGTQLRVLVGDILDLSKIEAGKYRLEEHYVHLPDLIASAADSVRRQAEEAGLVLRTEVPSSLPHVRADPRALKQILLSLLSNAIKFTPEGGTVTLTAGIRAGDVFVGVADTGVGIAKADLPRLGVPFEPIASGPAKTKSGTGLGLALCSKLAELHGGRLEIESAPGKGTAIRVILPKERIFPEARPQARAQTTPA